MSLTPAKFPPRPEPAPPAATLVGGKPDLPEVDMISPALVGLRKVPCIVGTGQCQSKIHDQQPIGKTSAANRAT